jgi:hypothetical protein
MAGCDAVSASASQTVAELRAYLRKARRTPVPEFDAFLADVESFAKLRVEAEEQHTKARHRARNKRGALPLDWPDIARILNPVTETPEESLVTQVVRECLNEVEQVVRDLRKVLVRERRNVPLGRVQQVDAHCLRWLSRQPGRDAAEKAGGRQRILAVVRRENFDTLENRVFKDFISRLENPCREYLKRNESVFRKWDIVKKVRRMLALCAEALEYPALEAVRAVTELPYPNYVLRQERRYSKIWKAYCRVIRHASIAERLWSRRDRLIETLLKLRDEIPRQTNPCPCARFHTPLWFPYIDGKKPLVEVPYYEKQDGMDAAPVREICGIENDDFILDLNRPPRDLLIYPQNHPNAKPYLQDFSKPSTEDIGGTGHHFLGAILHAQDAEKLRDYFEQLYALVGGRRWVILVPDDWGALWQETVIRAVPLPRQNVFLLWHSVAALIGGMETLNNAVSGNSVAVMDIRHGRGVMLSRLTLAEDTESGGLVPQRRAFARHRDCYQELVTSTRNRIDPRDRFLFGKREEPFLSATAQVKADTFTRHDSHRVVVSAHPEWLKQGAQTFLVKHDAGCVAYFDELEALSLVVQTPDERVEARTLVKADEKFPGGRKAELTVLSAASIAAQEQNALFLLCMGDAAEDAPLKELRHELRERAERKTPLDMTARMTPGQGMAIVTVTADGWHKSVTLDFLRNMTDSRHTIASLEKDMPRSFPPDSPYVWADTALWGGVRPDITRYMNGEIPPEGTWFAKAAWIYPLGTPLPHNASPLERLRRKNVFGNDPDRQLPRYDMLFDSFDFNKLFTRLALVYNRDTNQQTKDQLARLIAWTYQHDFADFKIIRKHCVRKLEVYAKDSHSPAPLFQELTLCANLCVDADEWKVLLNAVQKRISNYNNNVARDFYLLYNLLQFHPTILSHLKGNKTDSCWLFVKHIPHWLDEYRQGGGVATNYILKSLLYFLRCRLYDGKKFLTQEYDAEHYQIVSDCLKRPAHRHAEHVRKAVLRYLNGEGRIDDLLLE